MVDSACTLRSISKEVYIGVFLSVDIILMFNAAQEKPSFLHYGHQDGHIRLWWYRGERTLAAGIRHRHIGPSPGVVVWGAIRYTSRSSLVRIDGTLNSARYISSVYDPWFYPLFES
ncbi:uncharacterized protein TNCV_2928401 [Trichonephila clavipes]|nr:uncharacterized protein TNCV_2928401 [Trichonephila clavipes]